MTTLFGSTRTVVKSRYALFAPDGFVPSVVPGWVDCVCNISICPAIGANFTQTLVTFAKGGKGTGQTGETEIFAYLVNGNVLARIGPESYPLKQGAFVLVPPKSAYEFRSEGGEGSRILLFQKKYEPLDGSVLKPIVGDAARIEGKPFLGNPRTPLQELLPADLPFDMAVNLFTYEPGATLPMVESHIMEHGLMMLAGQGIYRLGSDWHPVQAGDVIWMAPYCPQWFAATGDEPACYIYYKNVNRSPILS